MGTAHSEVNPNTRVMNSRGIWLSYVLGIGLLHVVLLSIPFFSVPVVWTLTNIIHNLVRQRRGPGLIREPWHSCCSEQSAEIPVETIPLCFQRCWVCCSTSSPQPVLVPLGHGFKSSWGTGEAATPGEAAQREHGFISFVVSPSPRGPWQAPDTGKTSLGLVKPEFAS